jgi:hypothetical protein
LNLNRLPGPSLITVLFQLVCLAFAAYHSVTWFVLLFGLETGEVHTFSAIA